MTDHPASTNPAASSADADSLTRPFGECLNNIFPTPLARHHWPNSDALNAELEALVLKLMTEDAGHDKAKSNVGGWRSNVQFINRDAPCLARLRARVHAMTVELTRAMMTTPGGRDQRERPYKLEGWANVLRKGGYNSLHVHPGCTFSGVYYVTAGAADAPSPSVDDISGAIEFIDPRPAAIASVAPDSRMTRRSAFSPPAGAMIMFPSWLQHLVHPYAGDRPRISIAFNIKLT